MAYVNDQAREQTNARQLWLQDDRTSFDVVALLATELTSEWQVEREIDPDGDLSIVVFHIDEEAAMPTFVLYESDGFAKVGTVRADAWEGEQLFASCRDALASIVAAADNQEIRAYQKI